VSSSNHRSDTWLTLRVFLPFVAGYYVSYAFRSMNRCSGRTSPRSSISAPPIWGC